MDNILEVENLTKYFPIRTGLFREANTVVRAVDNVSFNVERGQNFGLAGESGSGKTTLGWLVLRLIEPTSGAIRLDGEKMGETPLEVEGLKAKKYSVKVELDGYDPVDHEISLIEGIGRKLMVSLVKSGGQVSAPTAPATPIPPRPSHAPERSEGPPQMCSIFVNTQPSGAKIYVNGKHYGTSPKYIELAPGEHSIVTVKEFYKPAEKKIIVREGDTVLPPIDQRLVPTR